MSRLLRSLIPRRQAVAVSDDLARTFRNLQADPSVAAASRALEEAKLAQHFGRPDETFRNFELPLSTADEYAQADVGLFGNPAVRRMLQNAEFDQAIGQPMGNDVVEMLARNERMRTLEGINAQRGRATRGRMKGLPTNERQSLWDVAQQGIADARSARMADAVRSQGMSDMADAAGLAGLGALGAAGAAMTPFAFTSTDEPESAMPVEERDVPGMGYDPYRAMLPPTARGDGSVYLEPSADPPTPGRYDFHFSPASDSDARMAFTNLMAESPDIYVPPDESEAVAAMMADSDYAAMENDLPMADDLLPPFDAPTDAELKMIMQGAYESEMGGNLRRALAAGKITQDEAEDVITSPGPRTRLPAQYGSSQSMDPQRSMAFDTLVKIGKVDPKRALGIARGQIAPTMEELRMIGGKY